MIRVLLACLAAFSLASIPLPVLSQPAPADIPTGRKLLYPAALQDLSPALKPHVERLLASNQKPVDPTDAKLNGVYLRILSRQHVLDGTKLKSSGWLGTKAFVFLTIPETAYGRDLLGIFSAIGYDPEDILDTEKGIEKVAVVFAYPEKITASDIRDGTLPDDWDSHSYPSTWDNIFSLTDHMVADKDRWVTIRPEGDGFLPTKLQLRSNKELAFLTGYPNEGKQRIKATDYAALRETGGADWVYRQLLERLLGASEHFRGDGKTKLTLAGKRKPRVGFPEFLGPNSNFKDLPAVAVVGLGAIRFAE